MSEIINEIDFYQQRLKEAKSKLYQELHDQKEEKIKILDQTIEENWVMYHGDCIEVLKGIPSNSIHYSLFSPPFSSLFTYSASERDMGNSTDQEFYDHFHFFVPELYRVIMPGRLVSIHCSDIPAMKERDGYMGLKDFPGIILREFERAGFIYHSKVMIKKNELMEAQRTKALGLAHKQVVKDAAKCRNALPDYIITVHKPGNNPEPVSREKGFEYYIGSKGQPDKEKHIEHNVNRFSQKVWQRYASSVWLDIRQTNTLNVRQAREKDDERHVCPLQLDVIARCIHLWTNEGDTILSPFAGIGSEGDGALRIGRKFIGIELKKSYYDISCKNLKNASGNRLKGFL
jgi:DNA modification methylase